MTAAPTVVHLPRDLTGRHLADVVHAIATELAPGVVVVLDHHAAEQSSRRVSIALARLRRRADLLGAVLQDAGGTNERC